MCAHHQGISIIMPIAWMFKVAHTPPKSRQLLFTAPNLLLEAAYFILVVG